MQIGCVDCQTAGELSRAEVCQPQQKLLFKFQNLTILEMQTCRSKKHTHTHTHALKQTRQTNKPKPSAMNYINQDLYKGLDFCFLFSFRFFLFTRDEYKKEKLEC
jgi:hypothetical protein